MASFSDVIFTGIGASVNVSLISHAHFLICKLYHGSHAAATEINTSNRIDFIILTIDVIFIHQNRNGVP